MAISPINISSTQPKAHRGPNYVKYTGYAAVVAGVASGVAAKKKSIKMHTKLAYLAGLFTLIHVGLIEYRHFKKLFE